MRTPPPPGPDDLVLSGPITVRTAGELKHRMLAQLAREPDCAIHAAGVTELDGAGAQLLYAYVHELQRHGVLARWSNASLFLVEAARMLGMESCLGLTQLSAEDASWQP
jgi:ABC-type transporter Mla MlaB component